MAENRMNRGPHVPDRSDRSAHSDEPQGENSRQIPPQRFPHMLDYFLSDNQVVQYGIEVTLFCRDFRIASRQLGRAKRMVITVRKAHREAAVQLDSVFNAMVSCIDSQRFLVRQLVRLLDAEAHLRAPYHSSLAASLGTQVERGCEQVQAFEEQWKHDRDIERMTFDSCVLANESYMAARKRLKALIDVAGSLASIRKLYGSTRYRHSLERILSSYDITN